MWLMSPHTYVENSGRLESLIPPQWFARLEDSSIWLRLYTCLFVPRVQLAEAVRGWLPSPDDPAHFLDLGVPILFGWGAVSELKVPVVSMDLYSVESGQAVLHANVEMKPLPQANYIFLATPFRKDGAPGSEPSSRRVLDLAAGLVCLHAGINFMRECLFEGEVSGKDGQMTASTPGRKVPKPAEGPYLAPQNGRDMAEISERLMKAQEPKKSRVELALRLMDTAMRKNDGFFEYWTSLEVLCDGKANRIKDRFAKVYGLKGHKEAAVLGGLGVLAEWRGSFVHKGVPPLLTADIERYIQLVFIDLLRYELDLNPRHFAAAMQQAEGYDLSPLGLRDNRTEAQRRAYAETAGSIQGEPANPGTG
jgi:hypothetical protein